MLQLITAEYLYKYRPAANEGELTQTRSSMVNTNTLAALSEDLGVGDHLYLGKGIAKGGGRSLKSLLANAFEAILGAVFLDAGYDAAYHFYLDRFRQLPEPVKDENFKGRLQQVVQERFNQTPYYDSGGGRGSGHKREYTAVVFAGAEALGTGHGPTKQEAEQDAAKNALAKLVGEPAGAGARRSERSDGRRRRRTRPERAEEAPEAAAEAGAAGVTPAEVAEVLAVEEAEVEGVQAAPPAAETLAEPVAEPEVGGPAPEKPRRRRSSTRRKPAAIEAPVEAPALEAPPEAEPATATAAAPARRRRSPRRKPAAAAAEPAVEEPQPEAQPPAEPPRSRQFGEPLSD